tara:strand:+ start:621 stop:2183 length:1563 start_codon:yes stop_codon:yes gene_type:complete
MNSKENYADITADKLVNKINDLTIGEDSTDLLVVNSDMVLNSVTATSNVGIGTNNPQGQLHISSGTSGDSVLILEADTDNNNENDNPRIEFRQDGDLHLSKIGLEDNQLVIANSVVNQSSGIIFKVGTSNGFSNAVEKMRIHHDGNVGIGTTSPTEKLDINGNLHIEGDYICIRSDSNNDGNTGKPALYFSEDNYNSSDSTSHNDNGNVRIIYDGDGQNGDNNFIAIQGRTAANQFNNTLLHCETGGNVGIGTNDPKTNLHVNHDFHIAANSSSWNDTAGKGLYMRYSTNSSQDGAYIQSNDRTSGQDYPLTFEASKFFFKDGNVGIGTENPTEKLEVNGNISLNSTITNSNQFIGFGISPVGSITMYGGQTAPSGWHLCNGTPLNRTTYSSLFNIIGTTYGAGNGSTTFELPNMSGRFVVGTGNIIDDSSQGGHNQTYNLGDKDGTQKHKMIPNEMPSHTHSLGAHKILSNPGKIYNEKRTGTAAGGYWNTLYSGSAGGNVPHENRPPYIALNYIIRII